ncbi:MAG: cytochrome c oxidase subunit II transmembrane domain-containing protein [Actinomycetota bacterium]
MLERRHRIRFGVVLAAVSTAVVALSGCGETTGPDNGQNALRPAGPDADKILNLFRPFFWIAVVIGIGVVVGTVYAALKFRVKPGEDPMPKQTHGNTVLEVGWTLIPALILAVMAVPTVAVIFDLAEKPTGKDVVNITVSGRQWWWQFTYDNGIVTANEMHIPVGVPVSLTLEGPPPCVDAGFEPSGTGTGANCYDNGVNHSFWVPALNGKKDIIPGRTSYLTLEADRPGTFLGQCAEYCGMSHANMRLRVTAVPMDQYEDWVSRQLKPLTPEATNTFAAINKKWGCLGCHSADPVKPGSIAPNLTHLADRCKFAAEVYTLDEDNLTEWVHNAPGMKPFGPFAAAMPSFEEQGMTVQEANDIAKFLLENTGTSGSVPPAECN